MLKSPFRDSPFTPKISYILAALSIYDLEETKGEALWAYDPNSSKDREIIIKNYILDDLMYLSYRHRFILISMLKDSLDSPNFDFAKEFESDYDEHITIAWDETEIADPRGFFADIYRLAHEVWKDDLHKASLEDQSTW
ncbi:MULTISPECIES: hypothetical protein [Pseudomonas]|uniref:hypothetical protein n=1 Tax=Pseudomonas TaxID=286 RepID=UPI001AE0EFB7|nr:MULTISPECIES: hypothetical protein [unclassified Pseudomonas]MBP1124130.1 hypothetical protein [Pseudomonas sp. PvP025]MDQ0397990.1 hypothetical protein [Pseudomonas sp. PvP006]